MMSGRIRVAALCSDTWRWCKFTEGGRDNLKGNLACFGLASCKRGRAEFEYTPWMPDWEQ